MPVAKVTDKREQILLRLIALAEAIPGVTSVFRNRDEISERSRPAIAIFDGDETADERVDQNASGRAPNIIEMSPEVMILIGAAPATVGSALNGLRTQLVKAVLTDTQLASIVGSNGKVRYAGCSTQLGHGRTMEGFMAVHFVCSYVLRPDQL